MTYMAPYMSHYKIKGDIIYLQLSLYYKEQCYFTQINYLQFKPIFLHRNPAFDTLHTAAPLLFRAQVPLHRGLLWNYKQCFGPNKQNIWHMTPMEPICVPRIEPLLPASSWLLQQPLGCSVYALMGLMNWPQLFHSTFMYSVALNRKVLSGQKEQAGNVCCSLTATKT